MVKDKTPLSSDRCFLTNNRHPWDTQLAEFVSEIEENRDGRLGCREDEEMLASSAAHHRICLTEAQVQDAYLERIHLYRFRIIPDGNCLFRSVSQALFGTQDLHSHVRELCIEHLSQNVVDFLPFFEPPSPDEDLLDFAFLHIGKLRENCVWGGFESLMALSDMYNIEFHVILGGAVKNSSVTIHKYYLNRGGFEDEGEGETVPNADGRGCGDGDPPAMDDSVPPPSSSVASASASASTRLPLKKVFLIWLSCGHYDLAVDTPEDPAETEHWLRSLALSSSPESDEGQGQGRGHGHGHEQEHNRHKERRRGQHKSPRKRSKSSASSCPEPTTLAEQMPILSAALQGQGQGQGQDDLDGLESLTAPFLAEPRMESDDTDDNGNPKQL